MKNFVSALLIIGDDNQYLNRTLESVSKQPIDELIVVDTGIVGQSLENRIAGDFEIKYAAAPGATYSNALALAADAVNAESNWLWLLHDDSAPLDGALRELLSVADASPSAALIGPKQVDWNNPRVIRQLGLTLTRRGNLFTRVTGALDQSQHDADADVLALGTAGLLVRREVFQQLGGLDANVPALAADFDLSLRARLAGYRVLVAPQARVAHVLRSMVGTKTPLRKAEIQLQLSYLPLAFALVYWLALPLTTLVRVIWRLANKRPDRIGSELAAGLWGYFTIFARMRSRRRVSHSARKAMRVLYASRQQVRDDRLRDIEADEIEARVEAHAQLASRDGELETSTAQILLGQVSKAKSFVAGGGLWFVAALLALSWNYWPSAEAVNGGATIPLAQNWLELFARAGASWHAIGNGFAAPADPFVWVLTAFGALTFWAPSLSISLFFFVAKALAFFAAHKAISVFTRKAWIRNFAALSYVLWPSFTLAQQQLRVSALIALVFTPFVVYTVARVALLGVEISVRTKAQTWTWVALSGLSIAVVVASAPNTFGMILLGLILTLVLRPRRFGYLIWTGLPVATIFAPFVFYLTVGLAHPLAAFADPGVPLATAGRSFLGFVLGDPSAGFGLNALLLGAGTVLLALLGLLNSRFARVGGLLGFGAAALALGWVFSQINFVAIGIGSVGADRVNGNSYALLGIWALSLCAAVAVWVDGLLLRSLIRVTAVASILASFVPGIWFSIQQAPATDFHSSARVMPALIDAQAKAGSQARVLIISAQQNRYTGEWVEVGGVQIEDLSVAYRFALKSVEAQSKSYVSVAALVADLVTANTPDASMYASNQIQYVLVLNPNSPESTAISASLDQVSNLQSAGLTEYGKVWRVETTVTKTSGEKPSLWSITKAIQIGVLIGFLLLAIPTSTRRKQAAVSEIFIDDSEVTE